MNTALQTFDYLRRSPVVHCSEHRIFYRPPSPFIPSSVHCSNPEQRIFDPPSLAVHPSTVHCSPADADAVEGRGPSACGVVAVNSILW